jgi:hypothetical protein
MVGTRGSLHGRGRRVAFTLAVLAAVAAGCGTPTSTTQLWQAKDIPRAPMQRIIVFGDGVSETGRRTVEDGFVTALAARGVSARPSYELFPTPPDKEAARSAVMAAGFDGALVAKLQSVRDKPAYVAGGASTGLWDGYYVPSSYYIVEDKEVNVQTTLWDLRDRNGVLVWSAVTKTTNPSSGSDAVESLTKEVVPKLEGGGLIPQR